MAVSKTYRLPSSLPPFDSETATRLPSGEGTYQSIAVAPLGSSVFGSSTVRAFAGSSVRAEHAQRRLLPRRVEVLRENLAAGGPRE